MSASTSNAIDMLVEHLRRVAHQLRPVNVQVPADSVHLRAISSAVRLAVLEQHVLDEMGNAVFRLLHPRSRVDPNPTAAPHRRHRLGDHLILLVQYRLLDLALCIPARIGIPPSSAVRRADAVSVLFDTPRVRSPQYSIQTTHFPHFPWHPACYIFNMHSLKALFAFSLSALPAQFLDLANTVMAPKSPSFRLS
jgi:hypothetical protein